MLGSPVISREGQRHPHPINFRENRAAREIYPGGSQNCFKPGLRQKALDDFGYCSLILPPIIIVGQVFDSDVAKLN